MKNIIFPIGALALIVLAFSNRKTNIEPSESPKIDLTLEPVGTVNIDETPILEEYIQNSLKDPETNSYVGTIISGITGAAIAVNFVYDNKNHAYYKKRAQNLLSKYKIEHNIE